PVPRYAVRGERVREPVAQAIDLAKGLAQVPDDDGGAIGVHARTATDHVHGQHRERASLRFAGLPSPTRRAPETVDAQSTFGSANEPETVLRFANRGGIWGAVNGHEALDRRLAPAPLARRRRGPVALRRLAPTPRGTSIASGPWRIESSPFEPRAQ